MVDAVFQQQFPPAVGREATDLLNSFLIHGASPGAAKFRVTEIFTPSTTAKPTQKLPLLHMCPGSTFDLRVERDGMKWDFRRADHRKECRRRTASEMPYLVVGRPPCSEDFVGDTQRKVCSIEIAKRKHECGVLLSFALEVKGAIASTSIQLLLPAGQFREWPDFRRERELLESPQVAQHF